MRSRSVILFSALIAGCTTAGARPRADEPGPAAEPRQAERVTGPAEVATGNLERSDLDAEATVERSFRLVPIDGADVVLAVAEEPAGRTTRWRTFDAHGVASTPVVLEGFRLAGAVATPDVRLVVSNGVDLELRRLDGTLAGGPYPLRPEAVVALGHRRVAFLEERALPTPPAAEKPKGDADAGRGAASGSASTPAPAAGTRAKEAIAKGPAAKDKPANDKPAKGRAAKGKPANDKPAKGRTAKGKPANEGPTKSRAAKDKSANDKPAVVAATSPALAKKGPPPSPPLKPTPVKLWVHLVGDDGTLMDATETNVAFERPMPAMGLVAARGTTRGARLLWFEPEPPAKDDINQSPRAQLMAGALDSLGHRQGAPTPLVGGPRQYGFIDGHLRPRLFTLGDEGLYVGRHEGPAPDGRKRRWEARWLGAGAVEAPDATWVVDPRRVLERRPPRVPEMKLFERIRKASPGLVEPQSAEEPGRVAWAGKRGYFLAEGRLHSVAPDSGRIEPVPHPFVEQRATLAFGGVASDGSAVAATPRELSTIAVDGTVKRQALAPELSGLVPFQVAKVGARWLGVFPAPLDRAHPGGAKVVRIEAVGELAAPSLEAYPGSVALVGGATHAHWVTLDGDRLGLARLAADGELTRLATHPAPIRGGLAAVPRRAGGVLVVGPDRNGNGSIAAALDATGRLGPVTPLGLGLAPGRIELASLPEGGALAWVAPDPRTPDRSPRGVAWLDDDGRLLA
ncbi:MAG: hypothetical protein FJ096_20525, partial [Deltaproteobacteria bacterium]|nr:hypothetical protein [Deltaproteobacteria bacterium]